MDPIALAVVSALVGIILGGAFTAILGIVPVKNQLADLRVEVTRELGEIRTEVATLTGAVEAMSARDRRHFPRGTA